MSYKVTFSAQAVKDAKRLRKSEPNAFKKLNKLLKEVASHPETGTGKPEKLKQNRSGQWSRKITSKHRLIYSINNEIVEVHVISSYGHYGDK